MTDGHETRYKEAFCSYCYRYRQITGRAWKTIVSKDGSRRKQCPVCQDLRIERKSA